MTSLTGRLGARRARQATAGLAALFALNGCQALFGEPAVAPAPSVEPAPTAEAPPAAATAALSPEPAAEAPPPEPALAAPGVTQSPEPTRGRLPKAVISKVLNEANPDFGRCLEEGFQRKPELSGTINLNFVISPDGSVPYAAALEQGTDLPDEKVIECVLKAVQGLHFPEPSGGRVVVTHPLKFEPAAKE